MNHKFFYYLRWLFISLICGVLTGATSALFLWTLDQATNLQNKNPVLLFGLPIIGFVIGWFYFHFGQDVEAGNSLIVKEMNSPQKVIPLKMAPMIFIGTILTHLFGGSAGREGTAIQMGASISDQITGFLGIAKHERIYLLAAGSAAGFGSAIGTPWAGFLFGMEVLLLKGLRIDLGFFCFIGSFSAYAVTILLNAPHSHYPTPVLPDYLSSAWIYVFVSGLVFGVSARFFSQFNHWVRSFFIRKIKYPPFRPLIGGLIVVGLFYWEGSYDYVGLGIPQIQNAIENQVGFLKPFFKSISTVFTIGSGFKGGEFTPLVFIGTTLGSALSLFLELPVSFLAALGFAAVFAGASNTPLACTVMAAEIFGLEIAPFALLACWISYSVTGKNGIYSHQIDLSPERLKVLSFRDCKIRQQKKHM